MRVEFRSLGARHPAARPEAPAALRGLSAWEHRYRPEPSLRDAMVANLAACWQQASHASVEFHVAGKTWQSSLAVATVYLYADSWSHFGGPRVEISLTSSSQRTSPADPVYAPEALILAVTEASVFARRVQAAFDAHAKAAR